MKKIIRSLVIALLLGIGIYFYLNRKKADLSANYALFAENIAQSKVGRHEGANEFPCIEAVISGHDFHLFPVYKRVWESYTDCTLKCPDIAPDFSFELRSKTAPHDLTEALLPAVTGLDSDLETGFYINSNDADLMKKIISPKIAKFLLKNAEDLKGVLYLKEGVLSYRLEGTDFEPETHPAIYKGIKAAELLSRLLHAHLPTTKNK